MKRLALAFVTAALAFSFTGCSSQGEGPDGGDVTVNSNQKVNISGTDAHLYDVTLNDGTRCVVATYDRGGGITCDFNQGVTP